MVIRPMARMKNAIPSGAEFPCGPGMARWHSETRGDIRGGVLSTNCHQFISESSHTRKPAAFGWKMVKNGQKIIFKIRAWRNCPHGRLQVHLWSLCPWAPKNWVVASRWRLWYCQWAWAMWDLPQIWQIWRIWQWIKLVTSNWHMACFRDWQQLREVANQCSPTPLYFSSCFCNESHPPNIKHP